VAALDMRAMETLEALAALATGYGLIDRQARARVDPFY
jgi:hypothetical protein